MSSALSLLLVDGPYGMGKYPGDEVRTNPSRAIYTGVLDRAVQFGLSHVIIFGRFDSLAWIYESMSARLIGYELRADVVWEKPDWVHGGAATFAPRHELFLHFAAKGARFNADAIRVPYGDRAMAGVKKKAGRTQGWIPNPLGARCPDVIRMAGERLVNKLAGRTQIGKHPCEKPQGLLEIIVRACTDEWGEVHEPFLGSGNLAEVCARLRRRYIGYPSAERFIGVPDAS